MMITRNKKSSQIEVNSEEIPTDFMDANKNIFIISKNQLTSYDLKKKLIFYSTLNI